MKKILSNWRVIRAEPSGLFVWFDPDRESVELYELEPSPEERVDERHERGDSDGQLELLPSDEPPIGDLPF